jgi:hypothetical protein
MKNLSPHSITLPFAHPELIGQPLLLSGAFNMTKGYVYFFRHIGTTPVKIGMTTSETVQSRFDSFKIYAPYGAEILGYIETDNQLKLEQQIHNTFKEKRLFGEFFEISIDVVNSIIIRYGNKKIIRLKNDFEIWLTKVDIDNINFSAFENIFCRKPTQNENRISEEDEIKLNEAINKILLYFVDVSFITIKELTLYLSDVNFIIVREYLRMNFKMVDRAISFKSISGSWNTGKPFKIQ